MYQNRVERSSPFVPRACPHSWVSWWGVSCRSATDLTPVLCCRVSCLSSGRRSVGPSRCFSLDAVKLMGSASSANREPPDHTNANPTVMSAPMDTPAANAAPTDTHTSTAAVLGVDTTSSVAVSSVTYHRCMTVHMHAPRGALKREWALSTGRQAIRVCSPEAIHA